MMLENFRQFDASDPFGRVWNVEFRWYQNAISIRHADCVDVKYYLSQGEEEIERIIALPHAALRALAAGMGRELTDAWTLKIASLHLTKCVESCEDMDKPIIEVSEAELAELAGAISADEKERSVQVR